MNAKKADRVLIEGPTGRIEIVVADPGEQRRGYAIVSHPHPLHGGTLDNKVVQTLAKAFYGLDYAALRFNFRGVGASEGEFDDGRGEVQDLLAVAHYAQERFGATEVLLAGFSFGGFAAAQAARSLQPRRLVLIAPAVGRYPVGGVAPDTLVVHGEEDDVVALKEVLDWARPQQLPVVVFPGTGHFFHGTLVPLQSLVARYCHA